MENHKKWTFQNTGEIIMIEKKDDWEKALRIIVVLLFLLVGILYIALGTKYIICENEYWIGGILWIKSIMLLLASGVMFRDRGINTKKNGANHEKNNWALPLLIISVVSMLLSIWYFKDNWGVYISRILSIILLISCISAALPRYCMEKIVKFLLKPIQSYRFMIALFVIVLVGIFMHFKEYNMFTMNSDYIFSNINTPYNHGIGSSAIITIIGIIVGLLTILGFFETIKRLQNEKIDDYNTFYRACIKLFEETGHNDYLYFSGATLLPGSAFKEFDKNTYKEKKNKAGYFFALHNLILKYCKSEDRINDDVPKNIKLILSIQDKRILEWWLDNLVYDTNKLHNASDIFDNYKKLFRDANKMPLSFLEGNDDGGIRVANWGDDCIDYFIISNGKSVVFAKTLNQGEVDRPMIVGIKSDNPILINILEKNFENTWEGKKLVKVGSGSENLSLKSFIEGMTSEDRHIKTNFQKIAKKGFKKKIQPLHLTPEEEMDFYCSIIKERRNEIMGEDIIYKQRTSLNNIIKLEEEIKKESNEDVKSLKEKNDEINKLKDDFCNCPKAQEILEMLKNKDENKKKNGNKESEKETDNIDTELKKTEYFIREKNDRKVNTMKILEKCFIDLDSTSPLNTAIDTE